MIKDAYALEATAAGLMAAGPFCIIGVLRTIGWPGRMGLAVTKTMFEYC